MPDSHYQRLAEGFALSLAARNRAKNTVTSYLEAVRLLGEFLDAEGLPTAIDEIERQHIEQFIASLLQRWSPSTALNRYKSLKQFFRWCVEEGEIEVSPMARMHEPAVPDNPPPVVGEDDLRRLLKACEGRGFAERRDMAVLLLFIDTGVRLAELSGLMVDDVDLRGRTAVVTGKGSRTRVVPFGARTAQALDRYLRARDGHALSTRPELWLGTRSALTKWGVSNMVEKRARQAGLDGVHPHLLRHTFAHQWMSSEGSESDLMQLAGWKSAEMARRYGRSAASERAREAARRRSLGDRL